LFLVAATSIETHNFNGTEILSDPKVASIWGRLLDKDMPTLIEADDPL
jgi:hypothetical protein